MMRLKTNKQNFFMLCIREAENLAGSFKVRLPTYGAAKLIKTPGPTRGTPSYKLRWDAGGDGYSLRFGGREMELIVTVKVRPRGPVDIQGIKEALAYDLEKKYGDIVFVDVRGNERNPEQVSIWRELT